MRNSAMYKYVIKLDDVTPLALPYGSYIRTALPRLESDTGFRLYAEVNPYEPRTELWKIHVIGTGWPFPPDAFYLTTLQDGVFVWHIYIQPPKEAA